MTAAAAILTTSLLFTGGIAAYADPAADLAKAKSAAAQADQAVTKAQADLNRLEDEVGMLEESYLQAKAAAEASRQRASALQADVAAQSVKVEGLRKQAAGFARATFQSAGVDTTAQLFVSGDPESFLQQISTVAKVDENINAVLQRFQAEQGNLADLKRAADTEAAKAAESEAHMGTLEAQAKQKASEAQAVLESLTAQQQTALAAVQSAQASVDAAAVVSTRAASSSSSSSASSSSSGSWGSGSASSSAAARALAYAQAHVGYPYVWGAEGPNAFDCSGLVVAAYRSAGVSVVHSSLYLSQSGTPVSRANLRPGDLIFWFNPVHHVAIYEGNGMMVHAVNPRQGVIESSIDQWIGWGVYYAGARRVVG